ncbi:hypothetical protein A3715_12005 [Oleiphilus sp. HI0009]|uniref:ArsR/SmtB family transcription factor n=1 Tax=unclassified Oleiphilus TaxID=2631174 RepID=UPI0007C3F957|nr:MULTISPECIES: metalloregulator ArsR/SmtB family transcription factor [unclassified Oleiphilus]KZX77014.1 hypothetical protein A3715_12005 [Oleiphilus sp. HI0009]KZY69044.1 hypothetical protein A3739_09810 [Oleiphilus sp. HI0067]KZY69499.1 hypothetical protein A3738_04675 [Oleiphilus sp. HI0066]
MNQISQTPNDLYLASNAIDQLSQKLKACGDPLRVQILQCLKADAFGVLELTQIFDTKQSGMSHHLKVLSKAGLVEAQREGNSIFYRRPIFAEHGAEAAACTQLFSMFDALALQPDIEEKMQEIRSKRAEQSSAFFDRNADRFAEQQELICDHQQYAPTSFKLMKAGLTTHDARVLEVGPGEGQFLALLGDYYDEVDAVDTSPQMLEYARAFCADKKLSNVSLIEGDTKQLLKQNQRYQGIVMNMVLHHVPTPARLIAECAELLDDKGVLVLCDLTKHDQTWAKENCGDLWLGFDQAELKKWTQSVGFIEDESVFIGLRNGFQIQIYRYIKH